MTAHPWLKHRPVIHSLLCILPALLPACVIAQRQPPLFPITNFLPIGPVSTPAIADFNGDGQPDLIYSPPSTPTPSGQFATLTVLLNQGAANPTPIVTSSLSCTSVTSLMVADMNNDKKPDVILTCAEGFVAILIGNGDGTFQKPAYYSVPAASFLIPPTDLNADGFPDIAIANTSSVTILLNQGSSSPGTLSSPTSYPAPPIQFRLLGAGDFNGDGKPDLLGTANADSTGLGFQLVTYAGNGDGTFQSSQTQSTTTSAGAAVIADVNHDGFSDVVYIVKPLAPGEPQVLQVLLGNSSGQLTIGSSLSLDPSTNYTSLALAGSTDNNGININLALGGPATTILLGDGKGAFTIGQTYAIATSPFIVGSPLTETSSNGSTNLVFFTVTGITLIPGNGDGTFQALPNLPVGPTGFVTADVNRDGLTDVLSISSTGNLITALGRGNGSFTVTDQVSAVVNEFLLPGDFNGDGDTDVVAILPGNSFQGITPNSQLFFYRGNGDGSFQPASTGITLPTMQALHAVTGDFNGDGHLDVIVSTSGNALFFVPGNGDGTFGTPVLVSTQISTSSVGPPLNADLNQDKKPDLVWGNSIYLGNGDGTFRQQPLSLIGTVLAIGDLNGDGIPDLVIQPPIVNGNTPGPAVYAGLGDGTFQTTPFFAIPTLPSVTAIVSALIGDVNSDGHPDLVIETRSPVDSSAQVNVYLGDGNGNFAADPNTYAAGSTIQGASSAVSSPMATFARLNNRALVLPNDDALDYLTFTSYGATSLLNQLNPTPTDPSLMQSAVTLAVSSPTAMPNQQLTFTASVTGAYPTGTIAFVNGTTAIGTATIVNGTATLTTAFASVNTYSVIANYAGDSINLPSTSNAVSIVVAIPDFVVSTHVASSISLSAGQTFTTVLTIQPIGGYSGTVKFSCLALPLATSCSFNPTTTILANGINQATTLTISTTAHAAFASSTHQQNHPDRVSLIVWASLFLLVSLPKRMRRLTSRVAPSIFLWLLLTSSFVSLVGCSSSPAATKPPPPAPGTPSGPQSVTITAADAAGGPSHSINFPFTIQ